jgi:hypothetical protein
MLWAALLACFSAGLWLPTCKISLTRQRQIYWAATAVGAVCGYFLAYPDGHRGGGAAAAVIVGMVLAAVRGTPYLKIGDAVVAASATDRRADRDAADTDAAGTENDDDPE